MAGATGMVLPRALVLLLVLAGCGVFGAKDEPIEQPAELTEITPVLQGPQGLGHASRFGLRRCSTSRCTPKSRAAGCMPRAANGRVHSLELETGRSQWTSRHGPEAFGGARSGAWAGGGRQQHRTHRDRARQCGRRRALAVQLSGEVLAKPAVSRSVVVVRSVDGRLRALAADTGRELWMVEHQPPRLSLRGTAAPVISRATSSWPDSTTAGSAPMRCVTARRAGKTSSRSAAGARKSSACPMSTRPRR
jgi:outer membrane protein assembly factor BamB